MAIHYNAFISYRHHPDDIRVASEIHRGLERFHVPRSIRKRTGKIERLFRDKEELPITVNLTDDIDEALKNSDWLIVICSVHTRESVWVQREIELFLQTHPRNRVLTVLASGEPYDVIPEILLHEDVTDPVTGETVRRELEPLSCDWRMKRKKAIQEELPRLAAALLGCSYDELRQRQKQYRARRNMAIVSTSLAASLCLSAYFLYTTITIQRANEQIQAANIQIQANLDEALKNQSLHLATAAQERLAEGDRLTAIALASAALPSKNNPRPYVPEAELVLTTALGLYNVDGQTVAVGTISPGENIEVRNFWVTEDARILYTFDRRNIISAWDPMTLQKLGDVVQLGNVPDKLLTLPDGSAVIVADFAVTCYRTDGTVVWKQPDCQDAVYLPQENLILTIHDAADGPLLHRLDPATGRSLGQPLDLQLDQAGTDLPGFSAMSPTVFLAQPHSTELPVVIRYYQSYDSQAVYAIDLKTGSKTVLSVPTCYPPAALLTEDGKFIMAGEAEGSFLTGRFENNRVTSPMRTAIVCFDLLTGAKLWENEIVTSTQGSSSLQQIPVSRNILCQDGSVFQVMDPDTGVILANCDAGSSVIAIEQAGEDYVRAVLEDGCTCNYWYEDNYCYVASCMESSVSMAAIGTDSWYVHYLSDDHITVYRTVVSEAEWTSEFASTATILNQRVCGSLTAFHNYSQLCLFDAASHRTVWQTDYNRQTLLGFSEDGTKLWYTDASQTLTSVDTATGETETLGLPLPEGTSTGSYFLLAEDRVYYITEGEDAPVLNILNPDTGNADTCPLVLETGETLASYRSWQALAAQSGYVWLWDGSKMLLEVHPGMGTVRCLQKSLLYRPDVAVRQDSAQITVSGGGSLLVRSPGASYSTVFSLDNGNPVSVRYRGEELLVLCDNSYLYRLDGSGRCLSQTVLDTNYSFTSLSLNSFTDLSRIIWQFTADDQLILNVMGIANIIDCDCWSVRASISNYLMYHEAANDVVCRLGGAVGGYPLLETEQLLQLAEDALSGFHLTQEQKTAYGIQ